MEIQNESEYFRSKLLLEVLEYKYLYDLVILRSETKMMNFIKINI